MKSQLAIFGILLAAMYSGQSQHDPVQIGVRFGGQMSDVAIRGIDLGLDVFQPGSVFATSVGITADIPLGKGFYANPQVNYVQKGFRVGESIDLNLFEVPIPVGVEAVTRMNYIDVPINLKYKFGGEGFRGFVRGGPYIGYATGGNVDTRVNSIIDLRVARIPIDPSGNLYERVEYGATIGGGFEVKAGPGTFFTELSYQRAFTDFTDVPVVNAGLQNHGFGLAVGFAIPIGGKKTGFQRS